MKELLFYGLLNWQLVAKGFGLPLMQQNILLNKC